MEASVGKHDFYDNYLTARATPFEDAYVPEELAHGVQAVEASVDWTMRIVFTIQHYLHQIGLEVQESWTRTCHGCIMLDPTGHAMWSEIDQDCMRIKYADKVDGFTIAQLGVKPVRSEGRCLRVDYELVAAANFAKGFGEPVSAYHRCSLGRLRRDMSR
ncbi:hypothetical protein J3459_018305 [Metarhizium acridum]|nr:hypothetical protein J3459_018305 [Metarhizium acridum]